MVRNWQRWLIALCATTLAACAGVPQRSGPASGATDTIEVATASLTRPDGSGDFAYTDRPVQATLGPHRFRIPANYFASQVGPGLHGSMRLMLRWPELEPLPPGVRYYREQRTFYSVVDVSVHYLDQVPPQQVLDQGVLTPFPDSPEARANPSENLALARHGEPVHGLVPYYVDIPALEGYFRQQGFPTHQEHLFRFARDWYLVKDMEGALQTAIRCTTMQVPDGMEVQDGKLLWIGNSGVPACDHEFLLQPYNTIVQVHYPRPFLKDWRRIEDRVRALFANSHLP